MVEIYTDTKTKMYVNKLERERDSGERRETESLRTLGRSGADVWFHEDRLGEPLGEEAEGAGAGLDGDVVRTGNGCDITSSCLLFFYCLFCSARTRYLPVCTTHTHTHTQTHTQIHTHAYIHAYIHTYIRTDIYMYIPAGLRICNQATRYSNSSSHTCCAARSAASYKVQTRDP